MVTNIQLYESLRGKVGEEAARMISEVVPPAAELATKSDIAELKLALSVLAGEIKASEARLTRWMLTFFVPLWLGVWGVIVTLLLKM